MSSTTAADPAQATDEHPGADPSDHWSTLAEDSVLWVRGLSAQAKLLWILLRKLEHLARSNRVKRVYTKGLLFEALEVKRTRGNEIIAELVGFGLARLDTSDRKAPVVRPLSKYDGPTWTATLAYLKHRQTLIDANILEGKARRIRSSSDSGSGGSAAEDSTCRDTTPPLCRDTNTSRGQGGSGDLLVSQQVDTPSARSRSGLKGAPLGHSLGSQTLSHARTREEEGEISTEEESSGIYLDISPAGSSVAFGNRSLELLSGLLARPARPSDVKATLEACGTAMEPEDVILWLHNCRQDDPALAAKKVRSIGGLIRHEAENYLADRDSRAAEMAACEARRAREHQEEEDAKEVEAEWRCHVKALPDGVYPELLTLATDHVQAHKLPSSDTSGLVLEAMRCIADGSPPPAWAVLTRD